MELSKFEKFVLSIVKPGLEKKVIKVFRDSVLIYEILSFLIKSLLECEEIKPFLETLKKMGITIDLKTPDKSAVFILNSMRKHNIQEKLIDLVLKKLDVMIK